MTMAGPLLNNMLGGGFNINAPIADMVDDSEDP